MSTVDSAFSGHCVKRTSVLSGQILWSRQNMPLFQCNTLCVKRTSVLCGQRTDFLKIWSIFSVLSGHFLKIAEHCGFNIAISVSLYTYKNDK